MPNNVRVLVFDAGGRVLVVSEVDDRLGFKLPGGSVEPGEGHLVAARRELREELGVDRVSLKLMGTHPTESGNKSFVYKATLDLADIAYGPDIHSHQWVYPGQIPAGWPRRQYIVDALAVLGP